jgi:hypothetical protein
VQGTHTFVRPAPAAAALLHPSHTRLTRHAVHVLNVLHAGEEYTASGRPKRKRKNRTRKDKDYVFEGDDEFVDGDGECVDTQGALLQLTLSCEASIGTVRGRAAVCRADSGESGRHSHADVPDSRDAASTRARHIWVEILSVAVPFLAAAGGADSDGDGRPRGAGRGRGGRGPGMPGMPGPGPYGMPGMPGMRPGMMMPGGKIVLASSFVFPACMGGCAAQHGLSLCLPLVAHAQHTHGSRVFMCGCLRLSERAARARPASCALPDLLLLC